MIGMLVKFDVSDVPSAFDRDPAAAVPRFKQVPGLIFKAFIADRAKGIYGGFYVWEDQAAMDGFFADGGLQGPRQSFAKDPVIETFEVAIAMNGVAALAAV